MKRKQNIIIICSLCHKLRIITTYDKETHKQILKEKDSYVCTDHEIKQKEVLTKAQSVVVYIMQDNSYTELVAITGITQEEYEERESILNEENREQDLKMRKSVDKSVKYGRIGNRKMPRRENSRNSKF